MTNNLAGSGSAHPGQREDVGAVAGQVRLSTENRFHLAESRMMSLVVPGLSNDVQLPVETHCTGFDEARVCHTISG